MTKFIATLSVLSARKDVVEFCKKACVSLFTTNVIPILDELSELNATLIVIDAEFLSLALPLYRESLEQNAKRIICFIPFDVPEELRKYAEEQFRIILPFPISKEKFLDCCKSIKEECIESSGSGFLSLPKFHKYKALLDIPDSVFGFFAGNSDSIREVRSRIFDYADSDSPVLLLGETGTGKSSAAKMIHQVSSRRTNPFLPVNASSVVDALAVGRFFGVDNGAYTDAVKQKGAIRSADGGTLLVDEIGTSSIAFQSMLLSVIEDGLVQSLGSDITHKVDVRYIFATNANLSKMVEYGSFRYDLFCRISEKVIYFPPLRERLEDIPEVAKSIANEFNMQLTDDAIECLSNYNWPGNIRELRQCIKRAVECSDENEKFIDADLLEFGYL